MSAGELSDVEENVQDSGDKIVKIFERDGGSKLNKNERSRKVNDGHKQKQFDVIEVGKFAIVPSVEDKRKTIVQRSLPGWLANPTSINPAGSVSVSSLGHLLEDDVLAVLKDNKFESFFPVQARVIAEVLENGCSTGWLHGPGGSFPRDVCCSAPTGSGKTLAYVVPIVQILKHRTYSAIRCIVMVPTVELASQVYGVFKLFSAKTSIKVGLANGMESFATEQAKLVPRDLESRADVVVCTPGRFVDHVWKTRGFNLTKLRFLVVDEADEMLSDMKHNWLSYLKRAVLEPLVKEDELSPAQTNVRHNIMQHRNTDPSDRSTPFDFIPCAEFFRTPRMPLQKLLFSATLTHDPEKLEQLRLYQPKLFTSVPNNKRKRPLDVDDDAKNQNESKKLKSDKALKNEMLGKYMTPAGLKEIFIECSKSERPLVLLHMLKTMQYKNVLCFTNSVDTTHRLCALMKHMNVAAREYSSRLDKNFRARIIKHFKSGKIELMISSDASSRGLDLENVGCVVSYEAPRTMKNYVHRVGRTARAGRTGTGITLLERKEIHHFKKMVEEAGKDMIKELKVSESDLQGFVEGYEAALKLLQTTLKKES